MPTISRVTIGWNGSPVVGPGANVFHCSPGDEHGLMVAWRGFLDAQKVAFPSGLQWSFPTSGDTLDETSGHVNGVWTDGSPVASLTATGGSSYTQGAGARIKWTTGVTYGSHNVVGSTFLVPLQAAIYAGGGALDDTVVSSMNTALATFVAAANLRVYARPRPGLSGSSFIVVAGSVPDKVSWLRSRRT